MRQVKEEASFNNDTVSICITRLAFECYLHYNSPYLLFKNSIVNDV